MKLNNTFKVNGQEMDVWVDYDPATNTVDEILNISFTGAGQTIDVSEIMIQFFETRINQLIDDIDWWDVFCTGVEKTEVN